MFKMFQKKNKKDKDKDKKKDKGKEKESSSSQPRPQLLLLPPTRAFDEYTYQDYAEALIRPNRGTNGIWGVPVQKAIPHLVAAMEGVPLSILRFCQLKHGCVTEHFTSILGSKDTLGAHNEISGEIALRADKVDVRTFKHEVSHFFMHVIAGGKVPSMIYDEYQKHQEAYKKYKKAKDSGKKAVFPFVTRYAGENIHEHMAEVGGLLMGHESQRKGLIGAEAVQLAMEKAPKTSRLFIAILDALENALRKDQDFVNSKNVLHKAKRAVSRSERQEEAQYAEPEPEQYTEQEPEASVRPDRARESRKKSSQETSKRHVKVKVQHRGESSRPFTR